MPINRVNSVGFCNYIYSSRILNLTEFSLKLLLDDEFFVFTDIVNGSPLHILNLETETVRVIEGSINSLFFEKFSQYQFFDDIKSNKVR